MYTTEQRDGKARGGGRKPYVYISLLVVLCAAVGVAVAFSSTSLRDIWRETGQTVAGIDESEAAGGADDPVIATVNGTAIHMSSLERYKALRVAIYEANKELLAEMDELSDEEKQSMNPAPSDGELKKTLIEKQVKLQEAARLGLTASEQEINARLAALDGTMNAMSAAGQEASAGIAENVLSSYLDGLGITWDEYLSTTGAETAKEEIVLGKLAERFCDENGIAPDLQPDERNRLLSEYYVGLVEQADIELY